MTTSAASSRSARVRTPLARAAAAALVMLGGCSADVLGAPLAHGGAMFDDFSGAAGAPPDPARWTFDVGSGGWGNDELQTYTDIPENVRLDGEGRLVLAAVRNADGTYTSARVTTRGKFAFTNGRAEARIKVPAGDGLHPGFWLLGTDVDTVGWPRSGEIDVMETLNDASTYNCTLHGPDANGRGWQADGNQTGPAPLSDDFHTYWVQRAPGSIVMGVDQTTVCTFTSESVGRQHLWVFDKPFYLLLNVSVGGNYAGPPSPQTPSPSEMVVDWVSVTPS
jgi:beta-glucanase (GH16 family)